MLDVARSGSLGLLLALSWFQEAAPPSAEERIRQSLTAMLVEGVIAEGRVDDFIATSKQGQELAPLDPMWAYNIACGYSRKGELDTALEWIEKSIDVGGGKAEILSAMSLDADLDAVRADPRGRSTFIAAQERLRSAEEPVEAAHIDWTDGHRLSVTQAECSPDGSKIATASKDGWVRIWDGTTGELLVTFGGTLTAPGLCRFTDSGRILLTGGSLSPLSFWDARTGELLRVFPGTRFPMPGDLSLDEQLVAAPTDLGLTVVDLRSTRALKRKLSALVWGVSISPDGARVATGHADGSTRLFETWKPEAVATHVSSSPVFDVAFSPDGRWIVTGGADGTVRRLDARTLEPVREFKAHDAEVNSVVFSPDGSQLLTTSVDRTAKLWNAADDALQHTLAGHANELGWGSFSRDGKRALTPGTSEGKVRVWDTRTGALEMTLGGRPDGGARTLAFTAENTLRSFDKFAVREFELATGSESTPRGPQPRVRFKRARGGLPREILRKELPEARTIEVVEVDGAGIAVDAALVSSDQRRVCSLDADDQGRLWDAGTGRLVGDPWPLSRDGRLTANSTRWSAACFSPDGTLLATAQHGDGLAHLRDSVTGESIASFAGSGNWAVGVTFDRSGERLAVARPGVADVWSLVSGERVQSIPTPATGLQLAFSPDGKALATAGRGGEVRLWDVASGTCLKTLRPRSGDRISGIAFRADGARVAIASTDHRILLFDVEREALLGTIVLGEERGDWLAFAPSGHYHGTSAAIGGARLVQGAISYPLACFAEELENPQQVRTALSGARVETPRLLAPPSLVVARPALRTSTVAERVVRIEAIATDALAGLESIDVVQDGKRVDVELVARDLKLENNQRLGRFELSLDFPAGADETKITLQAVSTRGIKSRPESFVVRYEPSKRELYVLALGVADYANDQLDLAYPVQDVDDLVARLKAQAGGLFHAVHVERRVDREVTSAEAVRLRDEFLLRAKPDDTLVVFVAGHGVRTDSGEYWFLTSDATAERPYTGIKRADLELLVTWEKLHATRRVLLLDTCHAGSEFGKGTRGERGVAFRQSEVDTLLERSNGLYILAATSDEGFAREQEGNGLFTRALLDGLDGAADAGLFGNKDGTVAIDELMQFARYAVYEQSGGRQQPTFPRIEGGEGFPLSRAR